MSEDWQKVDVERAVGIIAEINPHLQPVPFTEESTTLRRQAVSFYKGYDFCELTDLSAIPAARKYVIYKPGDVNVISWTNQTIYDMNDKAPIFLNELTVVDYVRFFFRYVRGRSAQFFLTESIDDIRWQVEPPLQGRKVMQEMLSPVTLVSQDEDGTYNLEAYMIFRDSLFKTQIHVSKEGLVNMSKEELKIEGMPVQQESAA